MGKAINLSLKAIKATVEPYIGQTCTLVSWIRFFLNFALPISKRVNIITPLEKLGGNIKKQLFKVRKVCISS